MATDLLYATVTKTAGTPLQSRRGNVDWSVAALLAAGSIPATVMTIWVLSLMPREDRARLALFPSRPRRGTDHRSCRDLLSPPYTELCPGACRRSHANPLLWPNHGGLRCFTRHSCVAVLGRCRRPGRGRSLFLYPRLPPARVVGSDLAHAVPLTLVAGLSATG